MENNLRYWYEAYLEAQPYSKYSEEKYYKLYDCLESLFGDTLRFCTDGEFWIDLARYTEQKNDYAEFITWLKEILSPAFKEEYFDYIMKEETEANEE